MRPQVEGPVMLFRKTKLLVMLFTSLWASACNPVAPISAPPTPAYLDRLPPGKQTMEMEEWARRATAIAGTPGPTVPPPASYVPKPTVIVLPHQQLGTGVLVEGGHGPYPGFIYTDTNSWSATIKGNEYWVIAGAIWGDESGARLSKPWQGVVHVYISTPDGRALNQGDVFLTPVKAGTVRIVDADGTRLKLTAEDGTLFTFDVSTLKFVSP